MRWKGYSSKYDTWEPVSNLFACREVIQEFNAGGELKLFYYLCFVASLNCADFVAQNRQQPTDNRKSDVVSQNSEVKPLLSNTFLAKVNTVPDTTMQTGDLFSKITSLRSFTICFI